MLRPIIFFLFFFCSLTHFAIGQDSDSAKTEVAYWPDHTMKSRFIYTSIDEDYEFTYWYQNGQKEKVGRFGNGYEIIQNSWDREGKPLVVNGTGFYTSCHDNGVMWQQGLLYEGWKDSLWSEYYDNGRIKSYGWFRRSDSTGNWRIWYDNGQVKEAGSFEKYGGHRIGDWTCFDRNGGRCGTVNQPTTRDLQPSRSDTGVVSFFYPTGELRSRDFHSHLFQDSIKFIAYYKNGKAKEIKFKGLVLIEGYISFYDNGNKAQETDLSINERYAYGGTQIGTLYWYNGKPSSKTTLEKQTCYYPNGMLKCTGYYPPGDNSWIYLHEPEASNKRSELLKNNFYLLCYQETIWVYSDPDRHRKPTVSSVSDYVPKIVVGYPALYETSWYSNGVLKHQIKFDSIKNGILLSYFYPDGKICSQGQILYGHLDSEEALKWFNDPNQSTMENIGNGSVTGYEGYFKAGVWTFYNLDGSIKEKIDYEKEPLKKRVFDE